MKTLNNTFDFDLTNLLNLHEDFDYGTYMRDLGFYYALMLQLENVEHIDCVIEGNEKERFDFFRVTLTDNTDETKNDFLTMAELTFDDAFSTLL